MDVEKGAGFGSLSLYKQAGDFGRAADCRFKGVHVLHYAAASRQDVADAELGLQPGGGEAKRYRYEDDGDDVGGGPARNPSAQPLGERADAGQGVSHRAGGLQCAARLAPGGR